MSAHGLEVFDKTVQTTHIWLNDVGERLGVDRPLAWRVLGLVLREVRDALPCDVSAHLGAELPILVRGAYFQEYRPALQPRRDPDPSIVLHRLGAELARSGLVDVEAAVSAVMAAVSHHVPREAVAKAKGDLPEVLRELWTAAEAQVAPPPGKGELGPYRAAGRRRESPEADAPPGPPADARSPGPAPIGGMNARPLDETISESGPGIPDDAVGPDQMTPQDQIDLSEADRAARMADKLARESPPGARRH